MGHNTDVVYAEVVLVGDEADLTGWTCWNVKDGDTTHFYAKGPCPACGATAQGHIDDATHPVEAQGTRAVKPRFPPPVEVPVQCLCDAAHGRKEGETGCGRRWSVRCPGS